MRGTSTRKVRSTKDEVRTESAPDYTLPRLDLAKVYIRQKRRLAARAQLDALLATTDGRNPGDTELDDKPEARLLLKQIENK
jgi:hypothetical protein